MSRPVPKHISDALPAGASVLTPAELNRIRFASKHTVLTAAVLEAAARESAEPAAKV
ncbi:MAG: hypothetical protein K2K36_08960 [Muribaculaceae bacterium]|nr:hypothetical protein [Muribaculaceae bacterium]